MVNYGGRKKRVSCWRTLAVCAENVAVQVAVLQLLETLFDDVVKSKLMCGARPAYVHTSAPVFNSTQLRSACTAVNLN